MITYSHKDIKVMVNDKDIFCSSLNVSREAPLEPLFTINDTVSNNYYSSDFPDGSIDLSYYITGVDEFSNFSDKTKKYKIDFGGCTINSATLSSYSLSVDSNELLIASISLSFYDNISGIFAPETSSGYSSENVDVLKSTEVSVDGGIEINEGLISNLSYSYKTNFSPNYALGGGITPYNLSFKEDSVSLSMRIYDYNLNVPITGQRANFALNLKDKDYNTIISIPVSALINSKKISLGASDTPIVDLELIQANLGNLKEEDLPSIYSFSPLSGQMGASVNLSGNSFINIEKVMLGEFRCEILKDVSTETNLSIRLPNTLASGYKAPFIVKTLGGTNYFSDSGFFITSGVNI